MADNPSIVEKSADTSEITWGDVREIVKQQFVNIILKKYYGKKVFKLIRDILQGKSQQGSLYLLFLIL